MRQAEEQLVEVLLDRVTDTVADRTGKIHQPPWLPKSRVKVGVLRPRWLKEGSESGNAVGADEGDEDADHTLSDPDVLGMDFVVPMPDEEEPIRLSLNARIVLYQPLYPDYQVALRMFGAVETPGEQRPKQVPLLPAWKRCELVFENIQLELRVDGEHRSAADGLNARIRKEVETHFHRPDSFRPFTGTRQVVDSDDLATEAEYQKKLQQSADSSWQPTVPACDLVGFAEELPHGEVLVSITLQNDSMVSGDYIQDLAFYDCGLEVRIESPGAHVPLLFDLAPDDYRYRDVAVEAAHGRRAVAVESDGVIRTETLPRFYQKSMVPRTGHVPPLKWSELSQNPWPILDQVAMSMKRFLGEWDNEVRNMDDSAIREASTRDRDAFGEEIKAYLLGLEALRTDNRLERAFILANQAFDAANASSAYDSWRLFQLVYIVMHLPALAAREHRSRSDFLEELDKVDVLWFPTGGGKTEAYLGLILAAAFYDRLRGKHHGVTAWLKFPLRMLSVQQLSRVLRVLIFAEQIRASEIDEGAPFELGYLVGGGNTPNSLRWDSGWWPGLAAAAVAIRTNPAEYDEHRLVSDCPYCGASGSVGLTVSSKEYRLSHVCRNCEVVLPIHMTDDEVHRYQPSVVVSTLDKVTGFSHFGEFTAFNLGPRKRCPSHGYFSFGECPVKSEKDERLQCAQTSKDYEDVDWADPVPALTIQDELHLVREELGAFDSHFESLVAFLQKSGPSKLPTKVLGASATIEQFEDQLKQVYGRHPRRFPSPGYRLGYSFYVDTPVDTRRVFLGIMPSGGKTAKVEVAAQAQAAVIEAIHRWQDPPERLRDAARTAGHTALAGLSDLELRKLLFDYEVSLGFVNSKAHGTMIANELISLSDRFESINEDRIRVEVLTGQVDVPKLAEVIAKVEKSTIADPRSDRVRAVVGTSVVSHGVDLERLNVLIMAGLPSTTADYIQATSRSGRTHVGAVITVYDDFQRRESSAFTHFVSTHRLIDVLVEPVPVNRFAHRAAQRTLPSVVMALLWHLARDPSLNPPSVGIRKTSDFAKWWNTQGSQLTNRIESGIDSAYRSPVPGVNPADLENQLASGAVEEWRNIQSPSVRRFDGDDTRDLFRSPGVMGSLRDVEESVDFSGHGWSTTLYQLMFPERSAD
jgi:hypothetical protein